MGKKGKAKGKGRNIAQGVGLAGKVIILTYMEMVPVPAHVRKCKSAGPAAVDQKSGGHVWSWSEQTIEMVR